MRGLAGKVGSEALGVSYRDYIALERRAMASQESIAFWSSCWKAIGRTAGAPCEIGEERKRRRDNQGRKNPGRCWCE